MIGFLHRQWFLDSVVVAPKSALANGYSLTQMTLGTDDIFYTFSCEEAFKCQKQTWSETTAVLIHIL